jgi:hypothetical protein
MEQRIIDSLNLISKGSKSIVTAIEEGKNVNIQKAIRAGMLNNIKLVEILKEMIDELDMVYRGETPKDYKMPEGMDNIFGDIFKGK